MVALGRPRADLGTCFVGSSRPNNSRSLILLKLILRYACPILDQVCLVCGGALIQINGKAVCQRCHTIQGSCCDRCIH